MKVSGAARWWGFLLVLLATALYLAPSTLGPPNVFDEGFIATGAMLARRGALPIRDFFVIYGPGQYYFVAAFFALFGEDLFFMRAAHLLVMGLLGGAVFWLSALLARGRWRLIVFSTLSLLLVARYVRLMPGYAALLASLWLFGACILLSSALATGSRSRLWAASLCAGMAGLVRWDFGVFGMVTLGLTVIAAQQLRGLPWRRTAGDVAGAFLPALLLLAAGFLPFLLAGDALRWFDEVPRFLMFEFKTWRGLDFASPALADALQGRNLVTALPKLVYVALPLSTALATAAWALWRLRRGRAAALDGADVLALALALVALTLCNQMRVRPGWPQGLPAFVAVLPLIAYGLARTLPRADALRRALATGFIPIAGVMAAGLLWVLVHDLREATAAPLAPELPRATRMWASPLPRERESWSNYVALVRHVQQATAADEAIFSGVGDSSRLIVNDPMLYFLTGRRPATRWMEMEPGLSNTERGQREIVAELQAQRVRVAVLWHIESNEPNATSKSNGVHILDEYVQRNFALVKSYGSYDLLERRAPTESPNATP